MFYLWLLLAFALGVCASGVINYCFYRLPLEKCILWPGPRCGPCWQPIRWFDNIPLISYLVLRGRSRTCGGRVPVRHLVVELVTGLLFAGLFYAEIGRNVLGLPYLRAHRAAIAAGAIPPSAWAVFLSRSFPDGPLRASVTTLEVKSNLRRCDCKDSASSAKRMAFGEGGITCVVGVELRSRVPREPAAELGRSAKEASHA
jgi:hypothetical protein